MHSGSGSHKNESNEPKESSTIKIPPLPELGQCPILVESITDMTGNEVLIGPGGHPYNKAAIEQWVSEKKTDPVTKEVVTIQNYNRANPIVATFQEVKKTYEKTSAIILAYQSENQKQAQTLKEQELEIQRLKQALAENQKSTQQQIADLVKIKSSIHEDKKNSNTTLPRAEIQLLSDISIRIQEKETELYILILARQRLTRHFNAKLDMINPTQSKLKQKYKTLVDNNKAINEEYKLKSNLLTQGFNADASEEVSMHFFTESQKLNQEWKGETTKNLRAIKNFAAKKRKWFNHAFANTVLMFEDKDVLDETKQSSNLTSFIDQAFHPKGHLRENNTLARFFDLKQKINQISEEIERMKVAQFNLSESLTLNLKNERLEKPKTKTSIQSKTEQLPSAPPSDAMIEAGALNTQQAQAIDAKSQNPFSESPSDKKMSPEQQAEINEKLRNAYERKHADDFKKYLLLGADPNLYISDTPLLTHAIEFWTNNPQGICELILRGADVNKSTEDKQTALHSATYYRLKEVVKTLLDHKADPNALNYAGRTPLQELTYWTPKTNKLASPILQDKVYIASLLDAATKHPSNPLENKQQVLSTSSVQQPFIAQLANSPQPSSQVSSSAVSSVPIPKKKELTVEEQLHLAKQLEEAVKEQKAGKLKSLLEQGAAPSLAVIYDEQQKNEIPLLTFVIKNNWNEGLKILLEQGNVNPNQLDSRKLAPIHHAVACFGIFNKENLVGTLLESKANPTLVNPYEYNALELARYRKLDSNIIRQLELAVKDWPTNQPRK